MKPNRFPIFPLYMALATLVPAADVLLESQSPDGAVFTASDQFGAIRLTLSTQLALADVPGNVIAIEDQGHTRLIASQHQFFKPELRVVEILEDGRTIPFPNETLSRFDAANPLCFDSVLGLAWDGDHTIWFLDNAMREKTTPKLVAWDLESDSVSRVIYLPQPITRPDSFLNDLVMWQGPDAEHLIIADPASGNGGALIVVDTATGIARRLLQGHSSTTPQPGVAIAVDGRELEITTADGRLVKPLVGVNPIALVKNRDEWIYFGPMHATSLYRVPVAMLCDPATSRDVLSTAVEEIANRPPSDGMYIPEGGKHAWFTDVSNNALTLVDMRRKEHWTFTHPLLSFPSDFVPMPDGTFLVVANQLHLAPPFNAGENKTVPPYRLLKCEVEMEE